MKIDWMKMDCYMLLEENYKIDSPFVGCLLNI